MSKKLYGANGSEYTEVTHIPHELDSRGNVHFQSGGSHYYNREGTTYLMIRRGGDNWAGRQRSMVNVELQRRRFRK